MGSLRAAAFLHFVFQVGNDAAITSELDLRSLQKYIGSSGFFATVFLSSSEL